jgi:ArsR family transcriptional regulator, arsenate/arsenite/antimonite-responsive transcriptional repressor
MIIYLCISYNFEMTRTRISCCGDISSKNRKHEAAVPEQVRKELERLGGFEALSSGIPSGGNLEAQSRVFHALSDPLRLTILHLVKDQPLCVCIINRFMRIADSKLSYHLTILKESGLVEGEYQGNWIIYSITPAGKKYL